MYLFALYKKQLSWKVNATPALINWTGQKELYYQGLLQTLQEQSVKGPNLEASIRFWKQQTAKLEERVSRMAKNSLEPRRFLGLEVSSPEALSLITNAMINKDTKLIYQLNRSNLSQNEARFITESLSQLRKLYQFQWNWIPTDS